MHLEDVSQSDLQIDGLIGSGSYGVVFKGRYQARKVAIKRFRFDAHEAHRAEIEREIGVLKSLQDRYIIQYYGVIRDNNNISLITEYAEGGSLRNTIASGDLTDWNTKRRIAQEIASGLAFIHHKNIIHRDLKSDNVLLTRYKEVRLCDFGLAVVKKSSEAHLTNTLRGTLLWQAPELLTAQPAYSPMSDMYALGMVMWEMAAMCTHPFKDKPNPHAAAIAVRDGEREHLPDDTPADYTALVELCWKHDPSERLQAKDVKLVDDSQSIPSRAEKVFSIVEVTDDYVYKDITHDPVYPVAVSPSELPPSTQSPPADTDDSQLSKESADTDDSQLSKESADPLLIKSGKDRGTESNEKSALLCQGEAAHHEQLEPNGHHVNPQATTHPPQGPSTTSWFQKFLARVLYWIAMNNLRPLRKPGASLDTKRNKKRSSRGRSYLEKAEQRGYSKAQYQLGRMYLWGNLVSQDDIQAAKRFTMAAIQGHPAAQLELGRLFEEGRGVHQSDVEAAKWYSKAASQGQPEARFRHDEKYKRVGTTQTHPTTQVTVGDGGDASTAVPV
ncbi:hypothetical protein BGZ73_006627 [Actinomortierella ambigua]|nr:hypothetical protein BGZ73_006627 [Actinomortierella ambigua]